MPTFFRILFLTLLFAAVSTGLDAQQIKVKVHLDSDWSPSTTWLLATPGGTSTDSVSFGMLNPTCVDSLVNSGFQINKGFSGRIYIFVNAQESEIPTMASAIASDTTLNVRYDFIEATYFGGPYDCADLSSVDQFGLTLSMSSADSLGNRLSSVGYSINTYGMIDTMSAVVNETVYPAIYYDNGTFMRIISPLHTPSGTYTDMQTYVNRLCAAGDTLNIFDTYSGSQAVYSIDTTNYDSTYAAIPFCYQAILSPTSDSIYLVPNPNLANPSDFLQGTISINKADLYNSTYNMIYACDGPFYVRPSSLVPILGDSVADKVGFNDPWSTVVRNFLAGFNAGYYGMTDTVATPGGGTYINNGNDSWNWNPLHAFEQSGSYNPYAKVIMANSDSYGFPFSDFIAKPLLNLYGVDSLILNVWNDSTTHFSDYVPTFQSLTADTVNPVIGNNSVASTLTLNFGCSNNVPVYSGTVGFYENTYATGWTYTNLDTAHLNTNAVSCINFTGFPSYVGQNNEYVLTVEGKPFSFTVAVDSAGNFTNIVSGNPTVLAQLSGNNITLANLQYAISPAYLLNPPAQTGVAAGKAKKKKASKKRT